MIWLEEAFLGDWTDNHDKGNYNPIVPYCQQQYVRPITNNSGVWHKLFLKPYRLTFEIAHFLIQGFLEYLNRNLLYHYRDDRLDIDILSSPCSVNLLLRRFFLIMLSTIPIPLCRYAFKELITKILGNKVRICRCDIDIDMAN